MDRHWRYSGVEAVLERAARGVFVKLNDVRVPESKRRVFLDTTLTTSTIVNRLRLACLILIVILLAGLLLSLLIHNAGRDRADRNNVSPYFFLYTHTEPSHFALLACAVLVSAFFLQRRQETEELLWDWVSGVSTPRFGLFLALGVLLVTSVGTVVVIHKYPLAVDEFVVNLQAEIFASGHIRSSLSEQWRDFAGAMTSYLVLLDPQRNTWMSPYLPGYSAVRALFHLGSVEWLTNPWLAMLSILVLTAVSGRLWPDNNANRVLAVFLLATSPQFLINSMTSYAYPAHLCVNLCWLWLYTRNDRLGILLVPWVGVVAIGLHQPVVHGLFVAPFLLRLMLEKPWTFKIYTACVYSAGCLVWIYWLFRVRSGFDPATGEAGISNFSPYFSIPDALGLIRQTMNLSMIVSWQSVGLITLATIALFGWRNLNPIMRDVALSCGVTFVFYGFFNLDQGQGFGYRYIYGILGNFALLAAAGFEQLTLSIKPARLLRWLVFSSCLALGVQVPIRCWQTERFVRPFANSLAYIRSLKEPFVLVDPWTVWFAKDLVRNDPFLQTSPKVFFANRMTPELLQKLEARGEVHRLQPEELTQFGMHRVLDPVPVIYR